MAIFIPHIKGCNNTSEDFKRVYTWIKWPDKELETPSIYYNNVNEFNNTNTKNLGNIITSNALNQKINDMITISWIQQIEELDFKNGAEIRTTTEDDLLWESDKKTMIQADPLILQGKTKLVLETTQPSASNSSINFQPSQTTPSIIPAQIIYDSKMHNFKSGYVVIGSVGSGDKTDGSLYIQNSCNALYFNATSDIRAKTNLQHASFKALNIVKSLPIYTFNYRETGSPAIGLIAQDAAKISFGSDFSLVDNETASGENGDYMTIKESKLIYILWKAIQEQQEQINDLISLVRDLSRK